MRIVSMAAISSLAALAAGSVCAQSDPFGALYGPRRGTLAVVAYLLEGAAGAPVFSAGRAGLPVLMGPTGGYLLGFLPAAAIAGIIGGGRRPAPVRLLAMVTASLAVYAVGVPWLATVTGTTLSFTADVAAGATTMMYGANGHLSVPIH